MSESPPMTPLSFIRRPHQHRFQAWAPKLSRCIVLTSMPTVQLWAWLEGNPDIQRYCERPATTLVNGEERVIDFWFHQGNEERWWMIHIDGNPLLELESGGKHLRTITDDHVQFISPQSFEAHKIWIDNWLAILPYLASNARLVETALMAKVVENCRTATSLRTIEELHAQQDRMLVRTAVFMALHRGELLGIDLHEKPWDLDSEFTQTSHRKFYAA